MTCGECAYDPDHLYHRCEENVTDTQADLTERALRLAASVYWPAFDWDKGPIKDTFIESDEKTTKLAKRIAAFAQSERETAAAKNMVPAQELSDAGEDLVRLAAAKDAEIADLEQTVLHLQHGEVQTTLREMFPKLDAAKAEIAALTDERDEAIAHSDNDRTRAKAYRAGRDRATEQRDRAMKGLAEIADMEGAEGMTDYKFAERACAIANAILDAAETAPSLPETPE